MPTKPLSALLSVALTAVSLSTCSLPATAASLSRLPHKAFVYRAQNIPLADLLRDFAGALALPLVVAEGVSGTVNSNFSLQPEAFLETISKAFGLIWYFDGVVLYVYPSSQMQTRLFKLRSLSEPKVAARLAAFGLGDSRYPLRMQPGAGLALAFGPPRHIELVEAMISALAEVEADAVMQEVRGFPLKYASAVGRTVQGVTVPGVVTLLSRIYANQEASSGQSGSTFQSSRNAENTEKILGSPEQREQSSRAYQEATRTLTGAEAKPVTPNTPRSIALFQKPKLLDPKPAIFIFTGDEATNTVLVRGPNDRMSEIGRLLEELDVPAELIELEATIIDISSDEVDGLGVDWSYKTGQGEFTVSPLSNAASIGANITTLITGSGRELIARLRAIESRGTARIVARPKVLGSANRTAELSDKRTASVRVASNQDAKLFSVEAGTTLQVTPRLIADGAQTRISLDLYIEDGNFSAQTVDAVPLVQKTTIRTEATLLEGQSLLIGGIVVDSSTSSRSGLPLLSRLPYVGALFGVSEAAANRRQRLFLITPKHVVRALAPMAVREAFPAPAISSAAGLELPSLATRNSSPLVREP